MQDLFSTSKLLSILFGILLGRLWDVWLGVEFIL